QVLINSVEIGKCDNQFRRWRFDCTDAIQPGENTIELRFTSAEKGAFAEAGRLPYPVPYSSYPVYSPHRNLIRKTQCHSGWDWGPCLLAMGVYERIQLDFITVGQIESITTQSKPCADGWELTVLVRYHAYQEASMNCLVRIQKQEISRQVQVIPGLNAIELTLDVRDIEPWMPNGYGRQHLYPLTVGVGAEWVEKRIGFRTLEVKTNEDAQGGKSMTFCVNGRDIFCKGANWIPLDAFPARMTRNRYQQLLQDAIEAHMNMLRLWGGGMYEHECFYELCDEKGLLIWHDCMFSCSLYPAGKDFLENVEQELRYQIPRLQDHPSIALWCGNNENLGALAWFEESRKNRDRYIIDYDRLNEGVVGRIVRELDPERTWWPSSPSAGPDDFSDNWHTDNRGDMHCWTVWHEGKPFEAYHAIKPRFVSEFGYQAFPSLSTVSTYAPPEQWNLTSPVMEHHQKHPRGNSIIMENFTRYFRFPQGFEQMLYLSQVQQAMAIRTAVEYWRTLRPTCMGTLYWQLNDNWPVASWSSIDYTGKWKLLHYAAKRFFQPLLPVLVLSDGKLTITVVNDTDKQLDCRASVKIRRFDGTKILQNVYMPTVAADSCQKICTLALAELGIPMDDAFIYVKLYAADRYVENSLFIGEPKKYSLQDPRLTHQVQTVPGGFGITLSVKAPAFSVALDQGDIKGSFSDNLFDLRPSALKTVVFRCREEVSLERFNEQLKIFDLFHSFNWRCTVRSTTRLS
ncbi:MAG: beta-mannosidase, partial [Spirochaetae bacterium HGW-Spirochaetae-8]